MEHILMPYSAERVFRAKSIIVFAPHPDDEVFGCGGAIIRHIEAGHKVHVIILSSGGFQGSDNVDNDYIFQREQESIKAAAILGYSKPEFWNLPDRGIVHNKYLVGRMIKSIEQSNADLIYAPSPHEIHPDHVATTTAAIEATMHFGEHLRLAMYEVGAPLKPNALLDISDICVQKTQAMQCFLSQLKIQRYDLQINALNQYRTYTLGATVTSAEAYFLTGPRQLASKEPPSISQMEQTSTLAERAPRRCPQVSIIIRSMARSSLAATLGSIVASDYRPLQIVLVNAKGGWHQEPIISTTELELKLANQGGAALGRPEAANLGLASSTGSLALFLDDDDLVDPNHIRRLVTALDLHPERLAAYTGVRLVDHSGNIVREQNEPWEPDRLQGMNFLPVHAVMFRLQYARDHAAFDTRLQLMEDWDFWSQLARQGSFIRLEGCSATYNIGLGESGLSEKRDVVSMMKAHARALERHQQVDSLAASRALFWFDTALLHVQQEKRQMAENLASANRYIVDLENRIRNEESISIALRQEQLRLAEAGYQAELERLQQLQQQTSQQLIVANEMLLTMNSRLAQMEIELSTKNSETILAEATMARMLTSKSWLLTAPLRALAKAIRTMVNHLK